jgi:O-antigen/teichoic acid export membrane protein
MATSIIVATQLGPERRGYFGLVLLAVNTLTAFGHLGLGSAVTYYAGKKEYPRSEILAFLISSAFFLGAILAALFLLVYPLIPHIWTEIPRRIMIIGLIAVPFTFFHNFLMRFLLAIFRVRQKNLVTLIRSAAYLILVVILLWILKGGYREAAICYSASIVISGVLGYLFFAMDIGPSSRINASMVKPFLKYGSLAYLILVLNFLNHRLDIYLIRYFLSVSDVAYYQIAVNISERLWTIPDALVAILYPTLMAMERSTSRFTNIVCRNNLLITIGLAGCLAVGAALFVVPLYGEAYRPVSYAIYSLLWGIIASPVSVFLWTYFATRKQLGIGVLASSLGTLFNIGANLYLIPRLGIVGAGIATSLSYTIAAAILITAYVRQTGSSPREVLIVTREDIEKYREKLTGLKDSIRRGKNSENGPSGPAA